ncbi:MAG: YveK family protein [Lachnospiraceae bacterium]
MVEERRMDTTLNNKSGELDIVEIGFGILSKIWIVLFVAVVGALLAAVYTKVFMVPQYQSTAKVYVITKQQSDMVTGSDLVTSSNIVNDVLILVKSKPILEEVLQEENLDISYGALDAAISVDSPEDTRFLNLTVTYSDPYIAQQLVNALARVSVKQMQDTLYVDSASVVEEGSIPVAPSSPNLLGNTALGALAGFLLTCVIIAVIVILDDSLKSADDLEGIVGLNCLGVIPEADDFVSDRELDKMELVEINAPQRRKKKKQQEREKKKQEKRTNERQKTGSKRIESTAVTEDWRQGVRGYAKS